MKKRILTGVKPTGGPHIGNYLGAIRPAIALAEQHETFLFIADLHALTINPNPAQLREEVYGVAATWLALGVDPSRTVFYRQSDVPEIANLAWMLSCVLPVGMLERAHSFKDAQGKGVDREDIKHGVYAYPVLMAADILAFDIDAVPVGKDQKQHLEITQEAARKFNLLYGECLKVPAALIDERVMTIPGTDGRKMSKSYGNGIELFGSDKELLKTVKKGIKTDSTEYGLPLKIQGDVVFEIYRLIAEPARVEALRRQYETGRKDPSGPNEESNYFGWGDAKSALAELLLQHLGPARTEYAKLMADRGHLDRLLAEGQEKARAVAEPVLGRCLRAVGLRA